MRIVKKAVALLLGFSLTVGSFTACDVFSDKDSKSSASDVKIEGMRDIKSTELVSEMVLGWNLGNTLDSTGGNTVNSETAWGNPKTTKQMIDLLKSTGINVLRVPVTWEAHLGDGPEYTIDKAWLDRVQEVVNYAYDNDMFVILNLHHEDWHFPSNENKANAIVEIKAVWTQIAKRFEGYDERLIFEGFNEPRMKGTNYEWNGGTSESRAAVNEYNFAFVETIRESGGNNPKRHLMIPTYAASPESICVSEFVAPDDDKVIVSIHAYTPYNFALNKTGTDEWSIDNSNDTYQIDRVMSTIKNKFISKGRAVIIGEFGAMNKFNDDARVAWAEYFTSAAAEIGVPCVLWDNGVITGNNETFGFMKRDSENPQWEFPQIIDALLKGAKKKSSAN